LEKAKDFSSRPRPRPRDLTFKAKAKDSKFVLEDISRPTTKAKDNNTGRNGHNSAKIAEKFPTKHQKYQLHAMDACRL